MPSPLAHLAVGYALNRSIRPRLGKAFLDSALNVRLLWIATIAVSLLPDIDAVVGLILGDLGRYHNNLMSSLFVGLAAAVVFATGVWLVSRSAWLTWAIIASLSYSFHIFLDYLTVGRGVMALWPITSQRFSSGIPLFYGLHWSDGLISIRHIWTVLTELLFVVLLLTVTTRRSIWKRGQDPNNRDEELQKDT